MKIFAKYNGISLHLLHVKLVILERPSQWNKNYDIVRLRDQLCEFKEKKLQYHSYYRSLKLSANVKKFVIFI